MTRELFRSLRPFGRKALPVLAILFAACSGAKTDKSDAAAAGGESAAGGNKNFTIALIAKSSTNPVFLSGRQGAEAAAAELSKANGVNVKIDWLTPPDE